MRTESLSGHQLQKKKSLIIKKRNKMLICSHIRKPAVDMFPQREFSRKVKWKFSFDSYPLISKHVECVILMQRSGLEVKNEQKRGLKMHDFSPLFQRKILMQKVIFQI